jgi:hypothetical protein
MTDMAVTLTTNDLVTQFSGALESRDATRLSELKRTVSLVAAEKAAMQIEHARLMKKYGANSQQATEASGRVSALEQQRTGLASDVIRAATTTPAVEAGIFVVYGRVLDAQGNPVSGATVAAKGTNGSSLASSTSKSQGAFELRVPLGASKDATKIDSLSAVTVSPVSFQLVVTSSSLELSYTAQEILSGVSGRLAYREITLPDNSKSA